MRSEEEAWGLRDYDEETGELVGLEMWSASKVLPADLVDALPCRLISWMPCLASTGGTP